MKKTIFKNISEIVSLRDAELELLGYEVVYRGTVASIFAVALIAFMFVFDRCGYDSTTGSLNMKFGILGHVCLASMLVVITTILCYAYYKGADKRIVSEKRKSFRIRTIVSFLLVFSSMSSFMYFTHRFMIHGSHYFVKFIEQSAVVYGVACIIAIAICSGFTESDEAAEPCESYKDEEEAGITPESYDSSVTKLRKLIIGGFSYAYTKRYHRILLAIVLISYFLWTVAGDVLKNRNQMVIKARCFPLAGRTMSTQSMAEFKEELDREWTSFGYKVDDVSSNFDGRITIRVSGVVDKQKLIQDIGMTGVVEVVKIGGRKITMGGILPVDIRLRECDGGINQDGCVLFRARVNEDVEVKAGEDKVETIVFDFIDAERFEQRFSACGDSCRAVIALDGLALFKLPENMKPAGGELTVPGVLDGHLRHEVSALSPKNGYDLAFIITDIKKTNRKR